MRENYYKKTHDEGGARADGPRDPGRSRFDLEQTENEKNKWLDIFRMIYTLKIRVSKSRVILRWLRVR